MEQEGFGDTKCHVCYQQATKKCTDCGRVFCDLHVRYGGQTGGMYGGGDIGYYCDECWDRRAKRKRSSVGTMVVLGLVLLLANLFGFLVFRQSEPGSFQPPWVMISIGVFVVVLAVVMLITKGRR
jgi:hypothetical protein